jgi:hypothetical protein
MWIVSQYKSPIDWVKEYTDDYVVYDKEKLNVGYNIYSMMTFIIDHYDNLPDLCVFVKDNILERHITKDEFDVAITNTSFAPLLTQYHVTDGNISYYKDGVYHEKNNSWYFAEYPHKYFRSYPEFAEQMGLPSPEYLPFAPGANYIVPKQNILKHPKSFYEKLREYCAWSQINAESHTIERALYSIWK